MLFNWWPKSIQIISPKKLIITHQNQSKKSTLEHKSINKLANLSSINTPQMLLNISIPRLLKMKSTEEKWCNPSTANISSCSRLNNKMSWMTERMARILRNLIWSSFWSKNHCWRRKYWTRLRELYKSWLKRVWVDTLWFKPLLLIIFSARLT